MRAEMKWGRFAARPAFFFFSFRVRAAEAFEPSDPALHKANKTHVTSPLHAPQTPAKLDPLIGLGAEAKFLTSEWCGSARFDVVDRRPCASLPPHPPFPSLPFPHTNRIHVLVLGRRPLPARHADVLGRPPHRRRHRPGRRPRPALRPGRRRRDAGAAAPEQVRAKH